MRYIALVLFISISAGVIAENNLQVFVLHSYSQEYPWTKYQHEGFTQTLVSGLSSSPIIKTEHLDTKRKHFDQSYAAEFASYLKYKYSDYRPDLIYVTDDNALRFALSNIEDIFPEARVIFSGVNNYEIESSLDSSRITGVFEKKEIDTNIKLLKSMAQDVRDIIVVGDTSNTYEAIERDIRAALRQHPQINATFVAEININKLVEKLRLRNEKYLFLTTLGGMRDDSDQTLALNEIIEHISSAGDHIILSMEDAYLFDGVMGGYVTSGKQQGHTAATMALSFHYGKEFGQIALIKESPNEYIFDQMEFTRYGHP